MWAKGVLETIRKSKLKMPEKVLEILESKDRRKKTRLKERIREWFW